ncbi:MAG: YezD family protein [Burkholderiales bacterium]|jgi:hypothetical protein|nr:YezD family protein [Burkholderiales bacterium]
MSSPSPSLVPAPTDSGALPPAVIQEITRQLRGLRFGSVEIVVHEGAVTQIERREKVRLAPSSPPQRG